MGLNVKLKNDESKFSPILTFSGKNRCLNVTKVKYGRHGRAPNPPNPTDWSERQSRVLLHINFISRSSLYFSELLTFIRE